MIALDIMVVLTALDVILAMKFLDISKDITFL